MAEISEEIRAKVLNYLYDILRPGDTIFVSTTAERILGGDIKLARECLEALHGEGYLKLETQDQVSLFKLLPRDSGNDAPVPESEKEGKNMAKFRQSPAGELTLDKASRAWGSFGKTRSAKGLYDAGFLTARAIVDGLGPDDDAVGSFLFKNGAGRGTVTVMFKKLLPFLRKFADELPPLSEVLDEKHIRERRSSGLKSKKDRPLVGGGQELALVDKNSATVGVTEELIAAVEFRISMGKLAAIVSSIFSLMPTFAEVVPLIAKTDHDLALLKEKVNPNPSDDYIMAIAKRLADVYMTASSWRPDNSGK